MTAMMQIVRPPPARNVLDWPMHGVSVLTLGKRRDCTVESRAVAILARTEAPTKEDILGLVDLLPRNAFLRSSSGPYLVMGASPRSRDSLLNFSLDFPDVTRVFNRFMRAVSPSSRFSTLSLRLGCASSPHRDSRNGPCQAVVIAVSPQALGDGLWVQDPIGLVVKHSARNSTAVGTVVKRLGTSLNVNDRIGSRPTGHCARDRKSVRVFASVGTTVKPVL